MSLTDPFHNFDQLSYRLLTEEFGEVIQVAGDELLNSNLLALAQAIEEQSVNSIVIKVGGRDEGCEVGEGSGRE